MAIRSFGGEFLSVAGVVATSKSSEAYNFAVADFHTYFAGDSKALVHNCDCTNKGGKYFKSLAKNDKGNLGVAKWGTPKNVTDRLPSGWAAKPNKKGVGTRYQDPKNPGNGVRIDQGNPNHSLPSQQVDHVIVRRNGQVIGRDGNPIQGSIKKNAENAHIPLREYQKWERWDSP